MMTQICSSLGRKCAACAAFPLFLSVVLLLGLGLAHKAAARPYCDPTVCECPSPILIDTLGRGIRLTSAEDGVLFDIRADGHPLRISWTARDSGNAFLTLDRNGNGIIDNGSELFGNVAKQDPSTVPNGFLALAEFDKPINGGNADGVIDEGDTVYSRLLLWIDGNHDGISQPSELYTLTDFGITALSLDYQESRRTDPFGNLFLFKAKVESGHNSSVGPWAYDLFLTAE